MKYYTWNYIKSHFHTFIFIPGKTITPLKVASSNLTIALVMQALVAAPNFRLWICQNLLLFINVFFFLRLNISKQVIMSWQGLLKNCCIKQKNNIKCKVLIFSPLKCFSCSFSSYVPPLPLIFFYKMVI